jgi:antitoxin HigA-1
MNQLPAIHPGEFLAEILDDLHLTQLALAKALGVSAMRISYVLQGKRPVTAQLALLLGKAFGQTPQYWLNLQSDYDLKTVEPSVKLENVACLMAA